MKTFYIALSFIAFFSIASAQADVVCITKSKSLAIRKSCKSGEKAATIANIVKGVDGATGPTGPTGSQGIQGAQGPRGLRGVAGAKGSPGVSGRALEEKSETVTIAAGGSYGNFVTCSGAKKPLGGGCESSSSKVVTYYGFPDQTQSFYSYFCGYRNITNSPVTVTVTAHAVCAITN